MTSVDPSLDPTLVTDPHALHRARTAGYVAAELLGIPGVISAAVLRGPTAPAIAARAATLPAARDVAARFDLTWHSQGTGDPSADLWVHAFEGPLAAFPVTVYALGPRDPDPEVGTVDSACSVALLLGGLIL